MSFNKKVSLEISGEIFTGWEKIDISKDIDSVCNSFSVSLTDKGSVKKFLEYPINFKDKIKIKIDGILILTGYIDERRTSLDSSGLDLSVAGRDITSDIVDCNTEGPYQFRNLYLEEIANKLLKPFNLIAEAKTSTGERFRSFTIDPTEKIFEAIEERAKKRGLLINTSSGGILQFFTPGSTKSKSRLVEGENIESIDYPEGNGNRFSKYIVLGQGKGKNNSKGTAYDLEIERYRPINIKSEGSTSSGESQNKAEYEANIRASKSTEISCQVSGWIDNKSGSIWETDQIIPVYSPSLRIDGDLLITGVKYSQDSSGQSATLTLKRPDAYKRYESLPKRKIQIIKKNRKKY